MAQQQGSSSTSGGRLDGSIGTPVVAADFALGVGWGDGTPTVTVTSGSTDQRGRIVVQSKGANQAQATATVTLTFHDGAFAAQPFAMVRLADNDNAVTESSSPQATTISTTALVWKHNVLPVVNKHYTFDYFVVA